MANKQNADQFKLLKQQGVDGKVTPILLTGAECESFTSQLFGPSLTIKGELLVLDLHYRMTGHHQSYWKYYELSNGGFYIAPKTDEHLNITCRVNDFVDLLTPDASGIVATLLALENLFDAFDDVHLSTMYGKLKDFAQGHSEEAKILCAIY